MNIKNFLKNCSVSENSDLLLNVMKSNWCFPLRIPKYEVNSFTDVIEIFDKLMKTVRLQENAILNKKYYGKSKVELHNL